ncbi:hypothetical protein ACHAXR_010952 [Thalassiosira sp. AJA248-18]
MVLDSSDLQQRRVSTVKPSIKRTTTRTSTRRRRTRRSDSNRAAFIATLLFAAIVIPVVLITNRLLGKGSHDRSAGILSSDINDNRSLLQKWKPKGKKTADANLQIPSVDDLEAEQRAKRREQRYRFLYRPKFDQSSLGYDIYNCPYTPPKDYPMAWKTTEVLGNWNPNDVITIQPSHRDVYQGLCVFDYQTQYREALNYRKSEKPFVIRNDPKVTSVTRRWEDDPEYLHRVLGDAEDFRTERSPNNKFMWYRLRGNKSAPKGYHKPLNDETEMTFGEWLEHALEKDGEVLKDKDMIARSNALKKRRLALLHNKKENREDDPLSKDDDKVQKKNEESEESKQNKYYYFRINADLQKAKEASSTSKFIYDELTFLDPRKRKDSEFYMVDPKQERGINCRFGMRGIIAENHFDMSRNMIAVFGGERRYILSSPSQCEKMALYPRSHPSVRHSSFDWSNPVEWDEHPEFKDALINEVVLHAGDVLYLPTAWFHYIINLSLNYQCNARSGTTYESKQHIEKCGFDMK